MVVSKHKRGRITTYISNFVRNYKDEEIGRITLSLVPMTIRNEYKGGYSTTESIHNTPYAFEVMLIALFMVQHVTEYRPRN